MPSILNRPLIVAIVHYDNRDFDVVLNYQPLGEPTFNEQTMILGPTPGVCSSLSAIIRE